MKQNETTLQNASTLTARQLKAIPFVVGSPTYTEAIQKARVSRKTFYEWLKQPEFKAEIDRQRNELIAEAFGTLSQSLTKAVENLVGLLDNTDDRLKRLACKDVIEYILEHKAIDDLVRRIDAIEQKLSQRYN
jgi:phage terminase small subunit